MRYVVLVLLNTPIILLALINLVTKYKLGKISKYKFKSQFIIWLVLLIVLIGSFPIYNILSGRTPLDAHELSLFDIVQTTAIILLIYIINSQRQKSEQLEHRVRNLHQELSIRLSQEKER